MAVVEFHLHDIGELLSFIEAQGEVGKKAVSYTIKDIKSRAPGWVASETARVYNIKKTEIIPAKTKESKSKNAVSVYTSGDTLETVSIVYRGRNLTPIHFSMSPKMPSKQKLKRERAVPGSNIKFRNDIFYAGSAVGMVPIYKKYAIHFEVFKGRRWKIRGKYAWKNEPFLAPVKRGDSKYIVFQRRSANRTDMESIRTVSVPQMLGNVWVQDGIDKKITSAVEQRLQHHIDRIAPKE